MENQDKGKALEPLECTGMWWLPGEEAACVAGALTISTNGALQLSLVGTLGPQSPNLSKEHPVILGSVEKSPSGHDVTLTGCRLAGSKFGPYKYVRERYHATRGFFGAHLVDKDALAFRAMELRIGGLTEWALILAGFKMDYTLHHPVGERIPLASYTAHEPVSRAFNGVKVSLSAGLVCINEPHELVFRESASLSVDCETPTSVDELNGAYVYPLQNLLTFVCDRAQEIERFSVWPDCVPPSSPENPEIQVIGPRVQPDDEGEGREPVRHFQMLFTLEDIDFPEFIGKWLRLMERYADACNIYFGLKYGPPAYVEMTFLGIVQVLHLYHSRRPDGLAQRTEEETRFKEIVAALTPADAEWITDHVGIRPYPALEGVLRELVGQHGAVMTPLVSNRPDRFINQVLNTLHYVIHREPEVRLAASHGADLYWLMEKLRFLIKACFLAELGISEQQTIILLERNSLYQHLRRLEAIRESRRDSSA